MIIRKAEEKDLALIKADKKLIGRIEHYSGKRLGSDLTNAYVIESGEDIILFTEIYVPYNSVEVHIACPERSVKRSRELCKDILAYLFYKYNRKIMCVLTRAPEGKITNFCKKLGFVVVNKIDNINTLVICKGN